VDAESAAVGGGEGFQSSTTVVSVSASSILQYDYPV
jgi:hypothetical protein